MVPDVLFPSSGLIYERERAGGRELPRVPLRGEGSCGGGGAPRDSAGSGALRPTAVLPLTDTCVTDPKTVDCRGAGGGHPPLQSSGRLEMSLNAREQVKLNFLIFIN